MYDMSFADIYPHYNTECVMYFYVYLERLCIPWMKVPVRCNKMELDRMHWSIIDYKYDYVKNNSYIIGLPWHSQEILAWGMGFYDASNAYGILWSRERNAGWKYLKYYAFLSIWQIQSDVSKHLIVSLEFARFAFGFARSTALLPSSCQISER